MFRYPLSMRGLFLAGAALVAVATFTARPAAAQFSFGRGANNPFSGRVTVVNRGVNALRPGPLRTIELRPAMEQGWARARPALTNKVVTFLNERNIGSGFRTSRNALHLAERGELFVGVDGRGLTLRYVLRNNTLATSIRIPGPSPSGLDPRLQVRFTVEVLIDAEVRGTTLVAGRPRLSLHAERPTGRNLTGMLGVAAADLVRVLGGPDLVGEGLKVVNGREFRLAESVNLELAKLSPVLLRATNGIVIQPSFERSPNRVVLALVKAGPLPVVR